MPDPTPAEILDELAGRTVWDVLERTSRRLPRKLAVVDGAARWSFEQMRRRSEALAAHLHRLGLRKGDVAGIYMRNSLELVTIFYALQRLGVIVAWMNAGYREHEARFLLRDSGARAVFVFSAWGDFDYVDAVLSLAGELPELEWVVSAGPPPARTRGPPHLVPLQDLLGDGPPCPPPAVGPEDLSMLLYTSGTTGRPKGAMVRQSQVVRAGWAYSLGVDAAEEDVFLGFLPLTHSYGCGALLVQPFLLGATLVLMDRFAPEAAFRLIEAERVTLQLAAPAHYLLELAHPARASYDLSSLRAGMIAGQIAPAGLITQVERELGIYLSSFLGSSEVGPGLSVILPFGAPLEMRETYIGWPVAGTEARIADPATGREMPAGEAGELLLSGWHVMAGYWNRPEETEQQVRDGWLHTGDLALREADGCLRILGRLKECINRGGFKVVPSEIESLLVRHPEVEEVCVVGTPNPVLGESVCACVRPREGGPGVSLAEVRAYLEGRVAWFKLPDELLVLDRFPRVPGGLKIDRFGPAGVAALAREAPAKEIWRRRPGGKRH
ncbi:MAG: linear/branched/unsaturated fatty acid:CoA ligase LbuL [Deferrisomatales bacterium]